MNLIRDFKISKPRIDTLHPRLRKEVYDTILAVEKGLPSNIKIRVTQAFRTFKEQDALFLKRPKVTNAKGGESFHNYGLAFDFVLIIDDKVADWDIKKDRDKDGTSDWEEVAKAFKAKGWSYGGDWRSFKDYPHLEKTFGVGIRTALSRFKSGDVFKEGGYEYINID